MSGLTGEGGASLGSPDDARRPADPTAVLVVEDNDLVREMCAIVLRESGREIRTVTSAMEARAALDDADDIGIVVTDLTMPGEWSGPDLVRHLVATRPQIGIVVTTGMLDPDLSFAPSAELVHKPFSVEQLLGAVQRAGVPISER